VRLMFLLLALLSLAAGLMWTYLNPGPGQPNTDLTQIELQLDKVAGGLNAFAQLEGRYPTNDECLGIFTKAEADGSAIWNPDDVPQDSSMRGARDLAPVPGGIEGCGGLPLLYENRRDRPAADFAGSPIEEHPEDRGWLKVDKDIYLCSIPALNIQADARHALTVQLTGWVVALAAFLFFMVLCVQRYRKTSKGGVPAKNRLAVVLINLGLGSVLALFGAGVATRMLATCYVMSGVQRNNRDVATYLQVLDKYHARGVIGDEAYAKLKAAASDEAHEASESRYGRP
jgi:hypothetical protein